MTKSEVMLKISINDTCEISWSILTQSVQCLLRVVDFVLRNYYLPGIIKQREKDQLFLTFSFSWRNAYHWRYFVQHGKLCLRVIACKILVKKKIIHSQFVEWKKMFVIVCNTNRSFFVLEVVEEIFFFFFYYKKHTSGIRRIDN